MFKTNINKMFKKLIDVFVDFRRKWEMEIWQEKPYSKVFQPETKLKLFLWKKIYNFFWFRLKKNYETSLCWKSFCKKMGICKSQKILFEVQLKTHLRLSSIWSKLSFWKCFEYNFGYSKMGKKCEYARRPHKILFGIDRIKYLK